MKQVSWNRRGEKLGKNALLTMLILMLLQSQIAYAQGHLNHYTLNGYWWKRGTVYYVEQELYDLGWLPIIQSSFYEWIRHTELLVISYDRLIPTDNITPQDEAGKPGNGENEIRLSHIDGKDGTYGWTVSWFTGDTYDEFDIFLDEDEAWSTAASCPNDKVDVQNVLTHEIGHAIGLGDFNCYDETMYSYQWGGSIYGDTHQRTLFTGDIMGAQYLYGTPSGVGGFILPVDKLALLAPYIGFASTTIIALTATIIYVKRFKHKKRKQ